MRDALKARPAVQDDNDEDIEREPFCVCLIKALWLLILIAVIGGGTLYFQGLLRDEGTFLTSTATVSSRSCAQPHHSSLKYPKDSGARGGHPPDLQLNPRSPQF